MGSLREDTHVEPVDGRPGRFRAQLSRDWEIWGPNGGYFASVALRAAGAVAAFVRPASFSCLFLGVASFDEVDVDVTSIRRAKRAEALRVSISQGERVLLEGHVWAIDDRLPGLEHDVSVAPDVPGADDLKSMVELDPEQPPHRFWQNFVVKPVAWIPREEWPPPPPNDPVVQQWMSFTPEVTFEDDPWVDACRSVVLLDTFQWPAAHRAHVNRGPDLPAFIAPNMDLAVHFHRAAPASEWLLVDATSPVAESGLMAGSARLWSQDRRLVASATSHLLCREVPLGTPGSGTVAS